MLSRSKLYAVAGKGNVSTGRDSFCNQGSDDVLLLPHHLRRVSCLSTTLRQTLIGHVTPHDNL